MGITSEMIQKESVNFLEYQKGRALYHRMQVSLTITRNAAGKDVVLSGSVRDLSRQYESTVTLFNDTIEESACSCGEYDRVPGLCRHRAALLFQYISSGNAAEEEVHTSPAATLLLNRYEKKRLPRTDEQGKQLLLSLSAARKLRIVPKLICEGKHFQMEFRVGYDRLYVLRDLQAFMRGFQNGEMLELGKALTVENHENSYDENSLRLVRMICLQLETYLHHRSGSANGLTVYAEKIRALDLEESYVDEYMELLEKTGADYQPENRSIGPLDVIHGNGAPQIQIAARGNGAHVGIADNWKAVFGRKRMYLFHDHQVYCCSEEFSQDLRPFFYAVLNRAWPKPGHVDISGRDMPMFKRHVLPFLERHLPVDFQNINMEAYDSPVLEASFFLDMTPGLELTLTCEERYGSFSFNPVLTDEVPSRILRDKEKEKQIHDVLTRYFHYRDVRGTMIMEDEEGLYLFMQQGIEELKVLGDVYMTDAVQRIQVKQAPMIRVGMTFVEDMMQLSFDSEGMDRLELSGLLQSYRQKKRYHRFSNGDLVRLESGLSDAFNELAQGVWQEDPAADLTSVQLDAWHGMYLDSLFQNQNRLVVEESHDFEEMIDRMRQARPQEHPVPPQMDPVLHAYQKYGYGWMKTLQSYRFGGILADDMGLGKTIQMITLLLADRQEGRTSLIICPASLIYNWQSELRTFAPELKCLVVSGPAFEREKLLEAYRDYDVLVTSYDLVRRDLDVYRTCQFYYQILDEAQYIKNHTTMNAKAVKLIRSEYRMALTGTPIENRLSELWSIFDFLMPGYLFHYNRFHLLFEQAGDENREPMDRLKKMVSPFILRRRKKDVLMDLPEKNERVVYSGLEGTQKKLYQAAFLELKDQLSEGSVPYQENRMKVLAQLTRLRQICCDPSLCFESYHGGSAKLETCLELVTRAVDSDHKVLLFSQFTSMLAIISRRLTELGIVHLTLTGSTSKEARIELVNQFQTEAIPVFLISLKAGGTGLNLTAADIVIHYDPWWNVAAQNQATDRAHRIGQEKSVTVYRLIARDTLEESILKLQEEKRELSEDILAADFTSLAAMSQEELMDLISGEESQDLGSAT
ncbi:MAG: DEAD/DEAH box helicase [Lachnospiraceae bacterium]|nr:DEAD/DEAH box helicase [Lachnospiraceae bacterium]